MPFSRNLDASGYRHERLRKHADSAGERFTPFIEYIDQSAIVLYSTETLTELVDVLRRGKFAKFTTAEETQSFVLWILTAGEFVSVSGTAVGSRDLKDNKFLALAVAGKADYLVSGDKDLLVLGRAASVPIVSPAQFLAEIAP